MKVSQLRIVLKAAAELRAAAGDKEGAAALMRFADEVAPQDDKAVAASAKFLSAPVGKGLVSRPD